MDYRAWMNRNWVRLEIKRLEHLIQWAQREIERLRPHAHHPYPKSTGGHIHVKS
jgi:hypothetical protein